MSRFLAIALITLSTTAIAQTTPAAQEQPKWFVLRDHEIGTCWPALLVKVGGTYRHGFAQTAGGPYETQEQAVERRNALQASGTCQQ